MAKEVKELSKNKKENKNLSEELLSSYRSALFKMKQWFDNLEFTEDMGEDKASKQAKTIVDIGANLGKAIETLAVLEKKVATDEGINSKVRGNSDLGMFE